VVSKQGKGLERSSIKRPISVQPSTTASAPRAAWRAMSAAMAVRVSSRRRPRHSSSKITRCISARSSASGTRMGAPCCSSRSMTMARSSIEKRVPRKAARLTPAARSAAAVASAMCSSGKPAALATSSPTLCMVLVAISSAWAPAERRPLAAWPSSAAAPGQSASRWRAAMVSKSTLASTSGALCSPPLREATAWLTRR
jgi:hypothetical protein